jgi:hypothetical protein
MLSGTNELPVPLSLIGDPLAQIKDKNQSVRNGFSLDSTGCLRADV